MDNTLLVVQYILVVIWAIVIGVGYELITNCSNCHVLGWFGILLYSAIAIVVLFGLVIITAKLWRSP